MTNFKLSSTIFMVLMFVSTIAFSQTSQSTKKQNTAAKETSVTVNKTGSGNDAHINCQHYGATKANSAECKFIDDNKDGKCDKCGNTPAECKSKCKTVEKSGCDHKQTQNCSRSCSKTCKNGSGSK